MPSSRASGVHSGKIARALGSDDRHALGIDLGQFADAQDRRGARQPVIVEALGEIEMRVEEKEAQRTALMRSHGLDRRISDAMIAAHHQRHRADLQDFRDLRSSSRR